MRAPSDDELDVMARQARTSLEKLVDIKDRELDRKSSVGRQIRSQGKPHPAAGKVSLPTDNWKPLGLCWGIDGHWMDVQNGPGQREAMARELAFCSQCLVSDVCLEYGLTEPAGIWGGRLPKERRRIVKDRKKETV